MSYQSIQNFTFYWMGSAAIIRYDKIIYTKLQQSTLAVHSAHWNNWNLCKAFYIWKKKLALKYKRILWARALVYEWFVFFFFNVELIFATFNKRFSSICLYFMPHFRFAKKNPTIFGMAFAMVKSDEVLIDVLWNA